MSKKALTLLVGSLLLVSAVPAFAAGGDHDDDDGGDNPVAELVDGTPDVVGDFVLCSLLNRDFLGPVLDPDCEIDND